MRRLIKFLHTMGAIGLMGAMASLLVLMSFLPPPTSLAEYAQLRAAMDGIARWVFLPSFALTLIAGLLAMALSTVYQNAGWAWAKLATGIIIFEYGFLAVLGPQQYEAELSAKALAGEADAALLGTTVDAEWASLLVLLAVATANVVLGVWRPRFSRTTRRAEDPAPERSTSP
jgi:hypothetical protein